ncbi:MAG: putative Metallo-dependent phosphatase [Proteobacteria bacterium]|nr:putative Metallo-dependent phosphatase [Pseudomonadota bacterium]
MQRLHFNAIWILDTHLGLRACKAEFLLDFLQHAECKQLYLVGDTTWWATSSTSGT